MCHIEFVMELPFNAAELLGFSSTHVGPCAGRVPGDRLAELYDAIDDLAERSTVARALKTQYEDNSLPSIRSSEDTVYLVAEGFDILGYLRTGVRCMKVSASLAEGGDNAAVGAKPQGYAAFAGSLKDVSPCCLFDFFIIGGFERRGLGKLLFDAMVFENKDKVLTPQQIAYFYPSEAMSAFLRKHYGLTDDKRVSTFTVYAGFLDDCSGSAEQLPPPVAAASKGASKPNDDVDEPIIEEVEKLDDDPLDPYRADEDEIYTHRSKLYCFNADEWQDAGAGQVYFLQNTKSGRVRLAFVQEAGKRVLANHFIVHDDTLCQLQRHTAGNDKTWTWTAQERILERRFALKFSSSQAASEFKEAFDDAKRFSLGGTAVEYMVLRKVGVTAEAKIHSKHIKLLPAGATVKVVDVVYSETDRHVRAHILRPDGWITIVSHASSESATYAVARSDLDNIGKVVGKEFK
jgi:hypothetical protein